jgi:hypothetical protein
MADELSEDGNWRWDGFNWKPSEPRRRKGPPSKEESLYNKRKLRGGPPSTSESMRNTGQSSTIGTGSKSTRPTYSEDGLWMWNGEDWIPSPPKSPPEEIDVPSNALTVSMQDSVIGGDVNYAPQVIHNTQNIINSNSQSDINNPTEDFSEVSKNAYESGKKALQGFGIFVLIAVASGLIGLAFDNPVSQNNNQGNSWNNADQNFSEDSFDRDDYYLIWIVVIGVFWLITGLYIFAQGGPVDTFNRIREHYPASPVLELGDKGKNLHDVAKYSWLAPLILFIIVIIIGMIFMKIAAEMEKNKRN